VTVERLRKQHLAVGLIAFAAFLATGLHMRFDLGMPSLPEGPRALYRSGHVYLLFSALLNVALGLHLSARPRGPRERLQAMGSAVLMLTPAFFLFGFFVETPRGTITRPITEATVILVGLGLLCHLLATLGSRRS
jgi:hypothetical protein